jgi:hypothetical protein
MTERDLTRCWELSKVEVRKCGVLLLLNDHTLCDFDSQQPLLRYFNSAIGISNGNKLFTVRYELNLCTRMYSLIFVSEVWSTGKEGLADGAAAAMDRPRSVPFKPNPAVVLCTEYAPTVVPCYLLNIRYSSKYGTFWNPHHLWPDLNQRTQCYGIHTLYSFIAGIWWFLRTKQMVHIENEFVCSWRFYLLSRTSRWYSPSFPGNQCKVHACVHKHMVLERRGGTNTSAGQV